ncbi:hypothetical protein QVD17_11253 [Tagetes erecta]|uniref:Leucine-rich repeat-containing N-terminal plant-type domain-containing protein n=1 Tax=Tagetes erecta TaxID=13708 RepID=A0AAD8KUT2_TARER|nr:hypothetical protein QVD17_11253 [Tagetes erecta]
MKIFLISFIFNSIAIIPSFSCPLHQKQALLHFKSTLTSVINTTSYRFLELKSWNPSSDCCLWERVNCNGTKTVTELHLDGLVVPLPADIDPTPVFSSVLAPLFQISSLKKLDIISPTIQCMGRSPEMDSFSTLQTHISTRGANILNGSVSVEVGKLVNLKSLILGANYLSGKIPEEIGNLTELTEFSLQNNKFVGGIPSSVVNLKKLEILDLYMNCLSMQIPTTIGTLPSLTTLVLSQNQFTGPVLSSMRNLSKLELLRLDYNKLSGEIPTWLFDITTLDLLHIGDSGLNWNNEAKIVPRCNLRRISIPSCNMSGQIPEWISTQNNMYWLDLSNNTLEGTFPDFLAEGKLEIINLSQNNLNGLIPARLFEKNYFSGEIPTSISEANNLEYLDLSNNGLSLVNLPVWGDKLETLDLSYNKFSGNIPVNFPKGIKFLYLGGNRFCGNLPWNLSKLINLQYLDIHENNIQGHLDDILPQIPTPEALILRNNLFKGYILTSISNLSSLHILDISYNNLTGIIPQEITNLPKMVQLMQMTTPYPKFYNIRSVSYYIYPSDLIVNWKQYLRGLPIRNNIKAYSLLDLSHNSIRGEIPSSLGNLKALKLLSISHNKISGHIPVSLGELKNIESLDLSQNEISGLIPQSLLKLNQLAVLNFSNNKLTGKIPVGGQMDTMNVGFENNPGLCGMQIHVTCPEDIPPLKGGDVNEDEKESWFLWEGTWVGFLIGFFSSILIMSYFLDFLRLFKI